MVADLSGAHFGNYTVIAEVGRGAMGTVYRAYDPRLRREVAIKVLATDLGADEEAVKRFRREAVTVANLRHPNIVVVHDVGAVDNHQYIVMELLQGNTLRQEVERHGAFPLSRATHMLTQLADALDYAHAHNLVHRDVKSSNVIVGQNDHVTLTDFGLVKALQGQQESITGAGTTTGTLNYMAPEQIAGDTVDNRADIYALGVLAFEMLAGRLPFEGPSPHQVIMDIMHAPPPSLQRLNPDLTPGVDAILRRSLAKDPSDRFPKAHELAQALCRLRAAIGLQLVDSAGQRFPLSTTGTALGRGPDNDIVIQEIEVSRYHANVYCEAATWFVMDLGSTNGTCLNEIQLKPHTAYPLSSNDTLRLGYTTAFRVVASDTDPMPGVKTTSLR